MTALHYLAAAGFEAARRLPPADRPLPPAAGRCARLHGHSFRAQVLAPLPPGWAAFPGAEVAWLQERLAAAVAPLDYQLLNDVLDVPDDAALAGWIRNRLDLPAAVVALRGAPGRGAADDGGSPLLWHTFTFAAAHRLPCVPAGHPCGRLHGHTFQVTVQARHAGHDAIAAAWAPLHERLAWCCLNELLDNPTSELLAGWLWARLAPRLPGLARIAVRETATAGCHYDGAAWGIWKEQSFESALRVQAAPPDHPLARLHGHSFTARLHLRAPLDALLGWTVDFGDVKAAFAPAWRQLDHRLLNDLPELADADPGSLARWLRRAAAPALPALEQVDLLQADGGAVLAWGDGPPVLLP